MTLGDLVHNYRNEHDLNMQDFANLCGLSKAYISILERNHNPKSGKPPIPSLETIRAISSAMGLDFNDVIATLDGDQEVSLVPSPPLAKNIFPMPKMKKWRVLGTTACGTPLHRETFDETILAPENIKADIVFYCVGDSMINARIFDGDAVFVHRQPEVENGQIAVVRTGDEYTLKRVYQGDGYVELRAENPTFPPIILRGSELESFEIVGLAVTFMSNVR